jgi:hypothetical protein
MFVFVVKKRSYSMFIVTCLLYFLGVLLVSVGGLIVVNSIALYSALNCTTTLCTSVDPYGVSLIPIGGLLMISGLIYLIKMQCSINNSPKISY